jgi:hypothetical protein
MTETFVYLVRSPLGGYEDFVLAAAPTDDQADAINTLCQARYGARHRAFRVAAELTPDLVRVRVLGPDDEVPVFVPQPDAGPEAPWDGIDPSTRNNE